MRGVALFDLVEDGEAGQKACEGKIDIVASNLADGPAAEHVRLGEDALDHPTSATELRKTVCPRL